METLQDFRRIALPGNTLKRGELVNVFWLDKAGGVLADTGWDSDESFNALKAVLPRPPQHVLVTHLHPDHSGGVARLREWIKGDIYIPGEDAQWSDQPLPHGLRTFDAETPLWFDNVRVDVLLTPGHTPGHRCFHFVNEGGLVTGDMVLGEGTTWIGPPQGDMAQYMASLKRLRTVGHRLLLPGHGPMQTDPLAKIDMFLAHRQKREDQILDALAAGLTLPNDIVARNYTDTPAYLHPLAEQVVVSHLAKLIGEGKAIRSGENEYRLNR